MNKHSRSKSGLFLMELVIVILFFSISAAVCMRIFSTAKIKSDNSRDISNASVATQSCAESFKVYGDNPKMIAQAMEGTVLGENEVVVYYNADWAKTYSKESAKYTLKLNINKESEYKTTGEIDVKNEKAESLFKVTVVTAHPKSS